MQELAEEWGVDVEDALQEYVQQLEAALAERETQRRNRGSVRPSAGMAKGVSP